MLEGDPRADPIVRQCVDSFRFIRPAKPPGLFAGLNPSGIGYVVGYVIGGGVMISLLVAGIVSLAKRLSK